jgi:hypothetical protein
VLRATGLRGDVIKYKLKQILIVIFLALLPTLAAAAEVEGVRLADRVRIAEGGPELLLNGAGLRTRFFFRVYVGALYLGRKTAVAAEVIGDPGPKRIVLHLLRELSAAQLFEAMDEGFRKNHDAGELAKLDARVKQLRAVFEGVRAAKAGDVILLDWLPESGTRISVNGVLRDSIHGADFHRALLRIWLGENPADGDLKRALLGG